MKNAATLSLAALLLGGCAVVPAHRPVVYAPDNPWRPFCSERCRSLDLGAWSNEEFRLAASPEDDDDADPMTDPAAPRSRAD